MARLGNRRMAVICGRRGLRGGHWRNAQDFMRSSFRMWNRPTVRRHTPGFRLVREIE